MKRDNKFRSKCCAEWLIYVGNKLYVCPCCGLVYKEIMSWWDRYSTILIEDKKGIDEYIPSDNEIIDEYVEKELTASCSTTTPKGRVKILLILQYNIFKGVYYYALIFIIFKKLIYIIG